MKNWKTTIFGSGGVLWALFDIVSGLMTGNPVNWAVDVPIILAGIGLIFAKDFNVTGIGK